MKHHIIAVVLFVLALIAYQQGFSHSWTACLIAGVLLEAGGWIKLASGLSARRRDKHSTPAA
ncbi:hypothetical protein KSF73_09150 [Burkholderiaceae bacterium DAT-1]|nr:hypothetical protein [Burkholderiaceae bacterium DAT-1]